MKTEINSKLWDKFDRIYCISLKERPDRRSMAEKEFSRVGLDGKVEFFLAQKHKNDCEQGIYESHLACICKGLKTKAQTILIFEDDIVFDRFSSSSLKASLDFMETNTNWNVFFFGCLVKKSEKTKNSSILKVKYRSLTHAYVVRGEFAEKIRKEKWKDLAYDAMLRKIQEGFYVVYPSFAFQSDSPTDNINYISLDRFRRLFGGLKNIQKMNEFYFQKRPMVIAAHLIVIVILFLILYH